MGDELLKLSVLSLLTKMSRVVGDAGSMVVYSPSKYTFDFQLLRSSPLVTGASSMSELLLDQTLHLVVR